MSATNWTTEQSHAIWARGGSLLVGAAAGSGKTAVLVERVVSLLCDPVNPISADRLLVCTFSRAAAAEMRGRISARLSEMIREEPSNLFLQRQQSLLPGAQISTVHSFCADLLRRNFQHVEITPDFKIMEQAESELLLRECAEEAIEEGYAGGEADFLALAELLSTARDDRPLRETLIKLYEFARSHPFYEDWLAGRLALYNPEIPVGRSPWGALLLTHAQGALTYCVETLASSLRAMEGDERFEAAYAPAFRSDLAQIGRMLEAVEAGAWDEAVSLVRSYEPERLSAVRGDDPQKRTLQAARTRCKDLVKSLAKNCLPATGGEYADDIADLRPKIACLFGLVGRFGGLLWEKKSARQKLDYQDLEHLALSLLAERGGDGQTRRTSHAESLAAQYEHVLVDEYQDTNEAQDLLFRCVSREEENLFLVGDVKQSIYSFRQAMPEIFLARQRSYTPYSAEKPEFPAMLRLDRNFRSREEVTEAVNFLFTLLMSRELGDLDYDENESLRCGAVYPEAGDMRPEFHLLDAASGEGEDDAAVLEARLVAARIRTMLEEGFRVTEGGVARACEPRDFCILMRSPKGRAGVYVGELVRQGVAATAANADGFLTTREISGAVAVLRVILNPLLDMELIAAMLSPLFGFTAGELAELRLLSRTGPLWFAVTADAERGNQKSAAFLETLSALRREAASMTARELLQSLYARTSALEAVSAMPLGERRRQNLLTLADYAEQYHNAGYKGIARFVGLIDRLAEQGGDLEPAAAVGDAANIVRVMSVHRSKGLEFPIVFLSDTARRFNRSDLRENTLLHSEYGFACRRRDRETMRQYPTLPMAAVRLALRRTQLSEELRILYVALTRAKEKLIVTGTLSRGSLEKKLSELTQPLSGGRLPAFLTSSALCWLDWFLMALPHHRDGGALRDAATREDILPAEGISRWRIAVSSPEGQEVAERQPELTREAPADPALLHEIRRRMSYSYPGAARTVTPTKLAVSDVAKGERELSYRFTRRPRFLEGRGLTAAERGNAMHKFMQFADYERARDYLSEEISRMRKDAFLSPVEIESLSVRRLSAFFRSALAKRMFESEKILRELRFMAEFGQDKLGGVVPGIDSDSRVMLQGVADCVFIEHDGAVILDYKTDAVETMAEFAERYRAQLALYREILTESLGAPVKECVLYSFALSDWVTV